MAVPELGKCSSCLVGYALLTHLIGKLRKCVFFFVILSFNKRTAVGLSLQRRHFYDGDHHVIVHSLLCVCVCVCVAVIFFFKDEANRVIEIDKYVDQSKKNRRNAVDELPEAEKKKAPLPLFNQSSTESVCHPNKHSALESVEARNWNVVPW